MKKLKYLNGGNIRNYIKMPSTVLEERQRILDMKKAESDAQMKDFDLIANGIMNIVGAGMNSMGQGTTMPVKDMGQLSAASQYSKGGKVMSSSSSGKKTMSIDEYFNTPKGKQFAHKAKTANKTDGFNPLGITGHPKKVSSYAFGGGIDNPPDYEELLNKYKQNNITYDELTTLKRYVREQDYKEEMGRIANISHMQEGNYSLEVPEGNRNPGDTGYMNNCIYNSTCGFLEQEGTYEVSNADFRKDYKKLGFVETPFENISEGSIGQIVNSPKVHNHSFSIGKNNKEIYAAGTGEEQIKETNNYWKSLDPQNTHYYDYKPGYDIRQGFDETFDKEKNTADINIGQPKLDLLKTNFGSNTGFNPYPGYGFGGETKNQNNASKKFKKQSNNSMVGFGSFPFGGNAMQNIEIEGGETVETPDGKLTKYNGPSHEQGGIDLTVPEGTMISSDRLIDPKTGMTFSDKRIMMEKEIKKLESKLDKMGAKALERKHDNVAKNTIDRKSKSYTQKLNDLNKEKEEDMRIQDSFNKASNQSMVGFGSFPYGGTSAGMTPLVIPDEYFDQNNISPEYKNLNSEQKIDLFTRIVSKKPQLTEQEQSYLSKWKEMNLQNSLIGHDQFPYGGQTATMTPFVIPDSYFQSKGIDINSEAFLSLSEDGRMDLSNRLMNKTQTLSEQEKGFQTKGKEYNLQRATTGFEYPNGGQVGATMTPFTIPNEYFQNMGIDINSPYFTGLSEEGRMGLVNTLSRDRKKTSQEEGFDYKFKQSELQKATTGFDELYDRKYPYGGYTFKGTDISSKFQKYYKYDEDTGTWYTVDMKNNKDMPEWGSDVWKKRDDTEYLNGVFLKDGKLNPDYEKHITKYNDRQDIGNLESIVPKAKDMTIPSVYGDMLSEDLKNPYDRQNKKTPPSVYNENMDPMTLGEGLGIAGAGVSALGPLLTTLGAKDKLLEKNPNFFQNFGKDAIKANDDAQDYVARIRDNMLMRLSQEQRSQMASNRNSARGINTQRALDLGTYMASNQGANEIANAEAQQMMQLLSQKSQLENVQDQYTMQGALMADTANRQDLASYYSNLANNWANAGSALQNVGANLNMSKEDDFLDLLPLLNENGLTFVRENGKLKIVKINEG